MWVLCSLALVSGMELADAWHPIRAQIAKLEEGSQELSSPNICPCPMTCSKETSLKRAVTLRAVGLSFLNLSF